MHDPITDEKSRPLELVLWHSEGSARIIIISKGVIDLAVIFLPA